MGGDGVGMMLLVVRFGFLNKGHYKIVEKSKNLNLNI